MQVQSTIRILNNDIPDSYKVYEEYSGDYTFKCWINIEKIYKLFDEYNIEELHITTEQNYIQIYVDTTNIITVINLLQKYDFIS
jgi:dissimilatory sulfite reductase (desulfoviridin) alpha/beta subunit